MIYSRNKLGMDLSLIHTITITNAYLIIDYILFIFINTINNREFDNEKKHLKGDFMSRYYSHGT